MKLFDAHIHWQDQRLASSFEADFQAGKDLGIEKWICSGTSSEDWEGVKKLSLNSASFIPAYGLHPWYIDSEKKENWKKLLEGFLSDPVALVGEIGLDSLRDTPMEKQKEIFLFQWRLALKLGRPVIVHCRKCYTELFELIKNECLPTSPFLLHSYSGSVEQIEGFAKLGAYFSVSGNITSSDNKKVQKNALRFPLERILIETDAPAMPPFIRGEKWQGMNKAQNLIYVFKALAELRALSEEELALKIEENFKTFLRCNNG